MKIKYTDSEMLDWLEQQTDGNWWIARQSTTGRGFRLHNTHLVPGSERSAREAIASAMNKENNGLSKLP